MELERSLSYLLITAHQNANPQKNKKRFWMDLAVFGAIIGRPEHL